MTETVDDFGALSKLDQSEYLLHKLSYVLVITRFKANVAMGSVSLVIIPLSYLFRTFNQSDHEWKFLELLYMGAVFVAVAFCLWLASIWSKQIAQTEIFLYREKLEYDWWFAQECANVSPQ